MYIEKVPNRNSRPTILLREGHREGKKVVKKTLLNLTHWDLELVDAFDRILKGAKAVSAGDLFSVKSSFPHGHVEVILGTMDRLSLPRLISCKPCRQRNLILAMIAERIIAPCSKLATTRLWHTTTLAQELEVEDGDVDELYDALDWLLARQTRIENKLAKIHLNEEGPVLYDVSSSYYYGACCPLAKFGYGRDKKKGLPIIVYGLMTDHQGRPISIDVYPGNTGDPTTVPDQVDKLRKRFGVSEVLLVGDRGMLTQTVIDKLRGFPGIGWVSAMKGHAIRKLVENGELQMSLFDRRNLAEISSTEFPDERLIVCHNPMNAHRRQFKREALLRVTEEALAKIAKEVSRRTKKLLTKAEIGVKVGKVLNKYKVGKHFKLSIEDNHFAWERNQSAIKKEKELDGICVIRTNQPKENLSAEDTVRTYKKLADVEQAFRCMKGIDLMVRPIRHRTPDHVKAHFFLCMLAYYVEWHMRRSLAPLLFAEEELDQLRETRDPVAKAVPSQEVNTKKCRRVTQEGLPVHSFNTLLKDLATRCKVTCQMNQEDVAATLYRYTEPTPFQEKCFELLNLFPVT